MTRLPPCLNADDEMTTCLWWALTPKGRTKHPPRDRFNAILSFGYSLIQTLVHRSLAAVGIEPALGFFHQPRTAAHPLVLDLMELFRTPLWDMPVIASVN